MMDSQETRELATQHLVSVSKHHASQNQLRPSPHPEAFSSIESLTPVATKGTLPSPRSKKLVLAQDTLPPPMPQIVGNLSLLQKLNHILVSATEPEAVLQQITQALGETFQADCLVAVYSNHELLPQVIYGWQTQERRGVHHTTSEFAQHPALQVVLLSHPHSLCHIPDLAAIQSELDVEGQ